MTDPDIDLDALTALGQAATPAPWAADTDTRGDCVVWGPDGKFIGNMGTAPHWVPNPDGSKRGAAFDVDRRDAELIAAMRNNWFALLSALTATRAERDEARNAVLELGDAIIRANGWEPQNGVTVELSSALERLVVQRDLLRENRDQYRAELAEAKDEQERYRQEARDSARTAGKALRELREVRQDVEYWKGKYEAGVMDALAAAPKPDDDELVPHFEPVSPATLAGMAAIGQIRNPEIFAPWNDDEPAVPNPAHADLDWAANRDTDTADLLGDGGILIARLDYMKFLTFMEMTENTREFLAVGRCPACHGVDGTHTVRACLAATTPAAPQPDGPGHCGLCGSEDCPGVPGKGCTPGPFETVETCGARWPGRMAGRLEGQPHPTCVGLTGHKGWHASPYLGPDPLGTEYRWNPEAYDHDGKSVTSDDEAAGAGDGEQDTATTEPCSVCRGSGRIPGLIKFRSPCAMCGGTGKATTDELCSDKNGFHDGHDWTPDPCEPYRWCPGYPLPKPAADSASKVTP